MCEHIKVNKMAGTCNTHVSDKKYILNLLANFRPLGRHRRRYQDNIKNTLKRDDAHRH
jgi:hypothetical protein